LCGDAADDESEPCALTLESLLLLGLPLALFPSRPSTKYVLKIWPMSDETEDDVAEGVASGDDADGGWSLRLFTSSFSLFVCAARVYPKARLPALALVAGVAVKAAPLKKEARRTCLGRESKDMSLCVWLLATWVFASAGRLLLGCSGRTESSKEEQ